jgi:hypothetical protein
MAGTEPTLCLEYILAFPINARARRNDALRASASEIRASQPDKACFPESCPVSVNPCRYTPITGKPFLASQTESVKGSGRVACGSGHPDPVPGAQPQDHK